MIKRFGKMADQYQERINNQQEIISRLTKGITIAEQALYEIENHALDVEAARNHAKDAHNAMIKALEKEQEK